MAEADQNNKMSQEAYFELQNIQNSYNNSF